MRNGLLLADPGEWIIKSDPLKGYVIVESDKTVRKYYDVTED
jgi:hypothetical protein